MIVPQKKGCSSLVCSADLSIGCMLAKLKQLKETVEEGKYNEESEDEVMSDDTVQPPCLSQIHPLTKALPLPCAKETGLTTWLQ